jgi:hypothetical protein
MYVAQVEWRTPRHISAVLAFPGNKARKPAANFSRTSRSTRSTAVTTHAFVLWKADQNRSASP